MANGDQATPPAGMQLPPEVLQDLAEFIAAAMGKPVPINAGPAKEDDAAGQATPAAPSVPVAPPQVGQALGDMLAPLAAPILARAENRLKSRKLWVAIGTIAGLVVQNPLGLNLSPAAQVAIAAVAAIYVAAQAIVDSAQKQGGGNG